MEAEERELASSLRSLTPALLLWTRPPSLGGRLLSCALKRSVVAARPPGQLRNVGAGQLL